MKEKEKVIRFSHNFTKFQNQNRARLLDVRPVYICNRTPKKLIDYETLTENGNIPRPSHGRYIQLTFLGEEGIPFTVLRSARPMFGSSKEEYYKTLIGQNFRILIEEKNDTGFPLSAC